MMGRDRRFFSVIIPTYGRPAQLAKCLDALALQKYPADRFEVIIVDDGGGGGLDAVVTPFRSRLSITLLEQEHAGVAAGRNRGAAIARGEVLVFTDDDCQPAPDWLSRLDERFAENVDCIVGGRTVNALADNFFSSASQLLISYLFSYYNANHKEARFLNGSNLAVPAEGFHRLGGFDRTFFLMGAEERELCDRWRHSGRRMIYAPEVLTYHFHALTFRSFLRQHFNYGRGAFHFQGLYHERTGKRVQVEPLSFYFGMARYPFLKGPSPQAFLISILLCLSQAANLAGFSREKYWASKE